MTPHPDSARLERFDRLSASERTEVARHALGCKRCRDALTRNSPSALFALLALQPLPEEALDRLSDRVEAAVDAERSPATPRRWMSVASVAAALLLAALVGRELGRPDVSTAAVVAVAPPVAGDPADDSIFPARGVELISSPGSADVVDFALGETQVVMIFDKKLDI